MAKHLSDAADCLPEDKKISRVLSLLKRHTTQPVTQLPIFVNHLLEEASEAAKRLTALKTSKGYQYYNRNQNSGGYNEDRRESMKPDTKINQYGKRGPEEELDDKVVKQIKSDRPLMSPAKNDFEEEKSLNNESEPKNLLINLSESDLGNKSNIIARAVELGIECAFDNLSLLLRGCQNKIEKFKDFIKGSQGGNAKEEEPATPVTLRITPKLSRQGSQIEKKGLELGLICEVRHGKVIVLGSEDKVEAFSKYLIAKQEEINSVEAKQPTEEKNEFTQQEIDIPWRIRHQQYVIENKARELGLFYEYRGDKIFVLGPQKNINFLSHIVSEMEQDAIKKVSNIIAPKVSNWPYQQPAPGSLFYNNNQGGLFSNNNQSSLFGKPFFQPQQNQYKQNDIVVRNIHPKDMDEIKRKGDELGIIAIYNYDSVSILGPFGNLSDEFVRFIERRKNDTSNEMRFVSASVSVSKKDNTAEETNMFLPDYSSPQQDNLLGNRQRTFNLSPFHRSRMEQIRLRAQELELVCNFGFHAVTAIGKGENIEKFSLALKEVEKEAKKPLYPKHWDFNDNKSFSKTELERFSPEYQELTNKIFRYIGTGTKILKIERVQNPTLMDNYLSFIQTKIDQRPFEPLQRELLFHINREDSINSLILSGFENFRSQGISFTRDPNYALEHEDDYVDGSEVCQLLVADVFLGKVENGNDRSSLGTDSYFDGSTFFVHNSYQSYPLYVIEISNDEY